MFNVLTSYGCTQRKSLTLKFPNKNIFKDKSLVRHFIRGYVDGDGCLSYGNKEHTRACVSILGTKDFLEGIKNEFNTTSNYSKNSKDQDITKVLSYNGKLGYAFSKYLYENSTIYLKRKYERYNKYCLIYQR